MKITNRDIDRLTVTDSLGYLYSLKKEVPIVLKKYLYQDLMPAFRSASRDYMKLKEEIVAKYAVLDKEGNPIKKADGNYELPEVMPAGLVSDLAELWDLGVEWPFEKFTLNIRAKIYQPLMECLSGIDMEILSAVIEFKS